MILVKCGVYYDWVQGFCRDPRATARLACRSLPRVSVTLPRTRSYRYISSVVHLFSICSRSFTAAKRRFVSINCLDKHLFYTILCITYFTSYFYRLYDVPVLVGRTRQVFQGGFYCLEILSNQDQGVCDLFSNLLPYKHSIHPGNNKSPIL